MKVMTVMTTLEAVSTIMIFVGNISLEQIQRVDLKWRDQKKIQRLKKSFVSGNEFFAAFTGPLESGGECVAVCAFTPGKIAYLDEFCAEGERGIRFKTLEKAVQTKFKKCWLVASPDYDERTDSYVEAVGLNAKYREQPWLEEIKLSASESPWSCPTSLFFSAHGVSEREIRRLFAEKFGS